MSERAWVLRLVSALIGVGASACSNSNCPEDVSPNPQTACFTKLELGGSIGQPLVLTCPDEQSIHDYPIASQAIGDSTVEQVRDDGTRCCYLYRYPCE